jgi:hypothetical protein
VLELERQLAENKQKNAKVELKLQDIDKRYLIVMTENQQLILDLERSKKKNIDLQKDLQQANKQADSLVKELEGRLLAEKQEKSNSQRRL